MKLGLLSAILDGWSFEEMIDVVSDMGFSCVEVACWPQGKAERRYAGVSHIDVEHLDAKKAARSPLPIPDSPPQIYIGLCL